MAIAAFSSSDVRIVHLEVTDRCNAACPMCPRNDHGAGLNPNLLNAELSLADARVVFTGDFLRQLRQIYLCGNFGDPMVGRDTLEILKYFRSENPGIALGMHTNGSARRPEWWAELGRLLSGPADYCKFGIDGLADTNALYRRNTRWEKVMEATAAFIGAGGRAHWEYLVFRHNEHQVEEARELSRAMGFDCFFVKKTSRFFNYRTGRNDPFPVKDASGATLYHLEPPTQEDLVNPESRALEKSAQSGVEKPVHMAPPRRAGADEVEGTVGPDRIRKDFGTVRQYFEEAQVSCLAIREKTIYISAAGHVFPCCWLGGQYQYANRGPDGEHLDRLIAFAGGPDAINAKKVPVLEIIDGVWFGAVSRSWRLSSVSKGKVGTCVRQCGSHYLPFKGEYE